MKTRYIYALLASLILCCGCQKEEKIYCTCPPTITIYFQPFDNYSQQEAKQVKEVLEKKFLEFIDIEFEIASDKKIIIGLTHKDVSCSYKGIQDWGVLGLCLHGKHACVASDFRVKNKKRDYWKVVTHEFIHTFYHYNHCPKDDPTCIMRDAKGKPDLGKLNRLCDYCKSQIK